jgi:lysozyme family protein
MSLDSSLPIILKLEGGYSNDPLDHGGATNYGITQNTYDLYRRSRRLLTQSVKLITQDEVQKIYQDSYWKDGHCDIITIVNPKLATIHFDCCVNCGTFQAAKLLQRAVETVDDGFIGSKTMLAIRKLDDDTASRNYLNQRLIFYTKLILNNPTQEKFKSSWFHRLDYLSKQLGLNWSH